LVYSQVRYSQDFSGERNFNRHRFINCCYFSGFDNGHCSVSLLWDLAFLLLFPSVYSAAGKSKQMSAGVAIAAVSTIGFLGFLIGPPLIGIVAGFSSLRVSFILIAAMGLCVSIVATVKKFD
jgi:MFS family permease